MAYYFKYGNMFDIDIGIFIIKKYLKKKVVLASQFMFRCSLKLNNITKKTK